MDKLKAFAKQRHYLVFKTLSGDILLYHKEGNILRVYDKKGTLKYIEIFN